MFNERLKSLRAGKRLTQNDVAKALHISRVAYTNYELGNRDPDFDTLKKLANYFDVSVDYLLENSEVKLKADRILATANHSAREQAVVNAYRLHPEMQLAVDKILGIEDKISALAKKDMETASELDARIEEDARDLAKSENKS